MYSFNYVLRIVSAMYDVISAHNDVQKSLWQLNRSEQFSSELAYKARVDRAMNVREKAFQKVLDILDVEPYEEPDLEGFSRYVYRGTSGMFTSSPWTGHYLSLVSTRKWDIRGRESEDASYKECVKLFTRFLKTLESETPQGILATQALKCLK